MIRCDNGPKLTGNPLRDWCRFTGTGISYIEPESPWQNLYLESLGGRLRDELLTVAALSSLLEGRVLVEDWRIEYSSLRPTAPRLPDPDRPRKAWIADHPQLS